ncbi:MAG: CbtA family protein [Paracoccaceae bacterium]
MLKKLVASGMIAGVAAGLIATLLQLVFVVPLLFQAELYESGTLTHFAQAGHDHHAPAEADAGHDHDSHSHDAEPVVEAQSQAGNPPNGFDFVRHGLTLLSNIAAFCGFGLLLVAAFGLAQGQGIAVSTRMGALWGVAGFIAFHLAAGAGLPPELPGNFAADLQARQIWWVGAGLLTALGLYSFAYMRGLGGIVLGALLIVLPHIMGAPHPHEFGGPVPPELMALFVARSYAVAAITWLVLGAVAGMVWVRIQSQEA